MQHKLLSRNCLRNIKCLVLLLFTVITGCAESGIPVEPQAAGDATSDPAKQPSEGADGTARNKPLAVVVTVGMVADLVRQIGGDRVAVTQIMGSGVDPHLYKATRDDVRQLMRAELIFYSGLMLEGRLTDDLLKLGKTRPVVAVTEQIPPEQLLKSSDQGGHLDPHVWMDVNSWSMCIPVIRKHLSELDRGGSADYQRRAATLETELQKLHEYGRKVIASIPENRRVLITSHDAFSYFGRAYNLEVVGVQGLSTESEAGLARINELVDLLVDRRITAVFVESSVPQKNIRALIDGAASRGQQVRIGGELYSDAMGEAGTYEGTYAGMLDHNFTLVARGLGGEAPAGGMNGRLSKIVQ